MTEASATLPRFGRSSFAWIFQGLWKLTRTPSGTIALIGIGLLLAMALFAPWITPYDPFRANLRAVLQPPSWAHPFGTDDVGRDVLSRIIVGSRITVLVVMLSIGLSVFIGMAIGCVAGYVGGWIDSVLMRIMDGLLAFPPLILALAIVAALGPSLTNALIAIAVINVPNFARFVRGEVLAMRSADFVLASRAIGMPAWEIMAGPIRRRFMGGLLVYMTLRASIAVITESSLSFLGLGAQPPMPTWGGMISTGLDHLNNAWWLGTAPGIALFLTVLLLTFLGDALRDVLDVRQTGTKSA